MNEKEKFKQFKKLTVKRLPDGMIEISYLNNSGVRVTERYQDHDTSKNKTIIHNK